ncbi:MAG TPA: helix-turn-helix domain-containing protein [Candidatus Dormibacteraeota bacterium]|jgi:transcriptional regulator with XRE-family HTH domain
MTTKDVLRLAAARTHAATGTGRSIRMAAGLSVAEVAAAVGVAEPTVWRWEGAKSRPRGAAAIRWAELLDELKSTAKKNA